ncbi:hypothetical protein C8Q70DRAFT_948055 [Cubamyces menziesii]|nr:hypothetical protein C8Q70DRAFT_948055 [Cubamyces menziesii]
MHTQPTTSIRSDGGVSVYHTRVLAANGMVSVRTIVSMATHWLSPVSLFSAQPWRPAIVLRGCSHVSARIAALPILLFEGQKRGPDPCNEEQLKSIVGLSAACRCAADDQGDRYPAFSPLLPCRAAAGLLPELDRAHAPHAFASTSNPRQMSPAVCSMHTRLQAAAIVGDHALTPGAIRCRYRKSAEPWLSSHDASSHAVFLPPVACSDAPRELRPSHLVQTSVREKDVKIGVYCKRT